jgi:N-carbamoylputrescine amidase
MVAVARVSVTSADREETESQAHRQIQKKLEYEVKVTVCELPHELDALEAAWSALCDHTSAERSELVVLPEFVFVEPLWLLDHFDPDIWSHAEAVAELWLQRLPDLRTQYVVGTRPVTVGGKHFNEGFLWTRDDGPAPLRRKHYLPNEPGGFEARWFDRGGAEFPVYTAGDISFGLNICTELWALDVYRTYANMDVTAIIAPRATAAATTGKWLSVGTVAAVASGCYCLSSNRVQSDGACGGVGWIIEPDGALMARTSHVEQFCTREIEPARSRYARRTYPRYVFRADAK